MSWVILVAIVGLCIYLFIHRLPTRNERKRNKFIRVLKRSRDLNESIRAVTGLGVLELYDDESAEALFGALDRHDPSLSQTAARVLAAFARTYNVTRKGQIIDRLIAAWTGPDYPGKDAVDREIANALPRFGILALEPALNALRSDANQDAARTDLVAHFLKWTREPRDTQSVLAVLHKKPQWYCSALAALGQIGDPQYIPFIAAAVNDPLPEIRSSAALALGELDDDRCLPLLKEMAQDPELEVQEAALTGLNSFSSRIPPRDVLDAEIDKLWWVWSSAMNSGVGFLDLHTGRPMEKTPDEKIVAKVIQELRKEYRISEKYATDAVVERKRRSDQAKEDSRLRRQS